MNLALSTNVDNVINRWFNVPESRVSCLYPAFFNALYSTRIGLAVKYIVAGFDYELVYDTGNGCKLPCIW
jgi:hypothetical protein